MIRVIQFAVLIVAVNLLTGCATYVRDRIRDARDVFSVRVGRMTGIRGQAGPAVVAAMIRERRPPTVALGRDAVWQERMNECDRWRGVSVPPLYPIPTAQVREWSWRLGLVYRRHSWMRSGSVNGNAIRDITQHEVDDYHRARSLDDLAHLLYSSKRPVEHLDGMGRPTGVSEAYDYTEVGVRLKTRPMSDVGVEMGLFYGVSVRVNAMEALDFVLGLFCIDILHDDIPSVTPEVARKSFHIHRSRWY